MRPEVTSGPDGSPVLVWRFESPRLVVSSAAVGGGIGPRAWLLNATVPLDYARIDLDVHVAELAAALGCAGEGVGLLTAADARRATSARDDGVEVHATVGLRIPTWAADADGAAGAWAGAAEVATAPGTINVVAFVPYRLAPGALVNAVITATEAKTQALLEAGVPGTGTASDAVCIVTPASGDAVPFAGPRSAAGAALARAVHAAVAEGTRRYRA
jgi:adenosylcobinamide amidohydrolase